MDIYDLIAIVKKKLNDEIIIDYINIEDKSFLHKNHSSHQKGKFHLKLIISSVELRKLNRKKTKSINVGKVIVGGDAPISVQSMTNTLTTDPKSTIEQVNRLEEKGADIVRVSCPDESSTQSLKIITKETFIGGINGLIFAIIISLVSMYWFQDFMLGIVLGFAMILNLILAGFAGTIIPLSLDRLKIDPALASGVILTTITDVFGFLSFLGLASIFLI